MSGYLDIINKTITRTLIILLALLLGISSFGPYQPKVSADTGPDLIVQSITLSPSNPAVDDTVTITVTIKNQGTTSADASQVSCYMDSAILGTKSINLLGTGATTTATFTWQALPGSHTVKAIADSSEVIAETYETNNQKTFNFSTLCPDLIIQTISWSPQNPSKGDNVVFTVIVKNQGIGPSLGSNVILYIDGAINSSKDIDVINPSGTSAKTFNWVASPGQHTIKAIVDKNNSNKESNESNNEQTTTISTLAPDLVIQELTWTPTNPSVNDVVTFKATVKNQGTGRADACHLGYYIDGIYVTAISVGTLAGGSSSNITFTWTASSNAHSFKLVIDYYQVVIESNETNNEKIAGITTIMPDLVIQDVSWTPVDAGVGDVVTFKIKIKNQGNGNANASRATYYFGSAYQGYLNVPAINAGSEAEVSFTWTPTAGELIVKIVIDYDYAIAEAREDNNMVTKTITVNKPDLMISNIIWTPANPAVGDTITLTITLKNQGGGKAENFQIGYYIDDVLLDYASVFAAEGDTSTNKTCTWQVQNGHHVFKAVADDTRHVTESDEKNNEYSTTISPYMPDLTVGTVTWSPAEMLVGTEITFDVNINNLGNMGTTASRVAYYIDGEFVGYVDIGALNPGATITEHFIWIDTIGLHTIDVVTDANDQIIEVDETNNTKVIIVPPPDLAVQDITFSPPDVPIGDTVAINTTVLNTGDSATLKSLISCYVDDEKIASQELPQIDAGKSWSGSFNWVAESGPHTIKITADPNDNIVEIDETNNEKETEFSAMTPDLIIQDISWMTDESLESNEVKLTITVKNTGMGDAGACQLMYLLDLEPEVYKDIPAIPAGGSSNLTVTAILSAGTHSLEATANCYEEATELDYDNNEKTITFSTVVPDLVVRTINWSPLNAKIGDTVTISVKVENRGKAKAKDVSLALSVDGTSIGSANITELDANSLDTVDFSWTVMEGQHEFSVLTDAGQTIAESNEINNTKSLTLSFETPKPTARRTTNVAAFSPADSGFSSSWWWILLLVAALIGIAFFVTILRNMRKKY